MATEAIAPKRIIIAIAITSRSVYPLCHIQCLRRSSWADTNGFFDVNVVQSAVSSVRTAALTSSEANDAVRASSWS